MSDVNNPGSDECSRMVDRLYEFHDHALSAEEADEIRAHLLACEPCLDRYQAEDVMRMVIRRCCTGERAPDALRLRVQASFTRTVIVTTDL